MTPLLPSSTREIFALAMVSALATVAALARVLYGDEDVTARRIFASMLIAACAGCLVYSLLAGGVTLPGYAGVAAGIGSGLFTEEALRWSAKKFLPPRQDTDESSQ